jgi:ribulose-phosphate 3-epimerase
MLTNFHFYYSLLAAKGQDPLQSARNSNADGFHVDVMDGVIVKNVCKDHLLIPELKSLNKPIQVHLMGNQAILQEIIAVKPDTVFIHPHWCDNVLQVMYELRENNIKAGIVWNNDNTETYFDFADEILFMTVEPGASGQTFIENRIEKIKNIIPNKPSWVDGGVNIDTVKLLEFLPLSGVIVGSGIAGFNQHKLLSKNR